MLTLFDSAAKGSPEAQYRLALRVATEAKPYSVSAAVHWLERAAEQGDPDARHLLDRMRAMLSEQPHGPFQA